MKQLKSLLAFALAALIPMVAHSAESSASAPDGESQIPSVDNESALYVPGHADWKMYNSVTSVISLGANFNTGGKMNAQWFGSRPDAAVQLNYRLIGYLSRHWGIYGDLGFSYYDDKDPHDSTIDNIMQAIGDKFFNGITKWHFTFGVGAAYRYETGRLQIVPRVGINMRFPTRKHKNKTHGTSSFKSERDLAWLCADTGFELGYRTSRLCSIVLDIDYSLPLQKSKFEYTQTNESETKSGYYKSHSFGNELTVSLGLKINLGK